MSGNPAPMRGSIVQALHPETIDCGEASDLQILDLVCRTAGSSLYRASGVRDGRLAVVKLLDPATLSPEQIQSFREEYRILRSLDVPGIAKPVALVDAPRCLMMILEDLPGESLDTVLTAQPLDWAASLRMACQLARILAGLHAAHVVHRDMRPANLMLSPDLMVSPELKITLLDLHLATIEVTETAATGNPPVGDWAYVSPEQTGRMERPMDYRTDLYSLGVTLYRMLTGQLPFNGNDALEWAHCHIARLPHPPTDLNPAIPPILSAIVMKLLEKMPEDRYQRAQGLLHDLETCLKEFETTGSIAPFALGMEDWSGRLQVPQKLFGRTAEAKRLLESFNAMTASGRAALMLVSGEAGVGKSALVQELQQPTVALHGYFIRGKFDQYQREIPYATLTQAFRGLVCQILAESEARIALWRQQILTAVGGNGQLIVDMLPQVALIIGAQEAVTDLPPAEAQNRFRMVLRQFIGLFAQAAHPLTLFLDDLQWADAASLRLVDELATSFDTRCLLVIGAYRDNEVGPTHPLALALEQMRGKGAAITEIDLRPLTEEALCTLLLDMLPSDRNRTAPLANLIHRKTAGNPFFVIQFIQALAEARMIDFDAGSKSWRWDLAKIEAKGYTDNVAELMIDKLARLPPLARAALQRLACLDSGASQATLESVCDQPEEWAEHNPQNFLHSHALVSAEIARIEGRESDAEQLYEQAIASSRKSGFIHNEAIAFEVASRFYRARGFGLIADTYLGEARAGYLRWGAEGKVAHLDAAYPHLARQSAADARLAEADAVTQLDVLSVVKASQAISGPLVLHELSGTLLNIVLENAGAQTGALLLCGREGLELAARASVDDVDVTVRLSNKLAPADASLPSAILNYVQRTREMVLLSDVAQPNPFSADPYFTVRHPKSVLCLPVLRKNALIALLYLENDLVHAFAPQRIAALELLATQAAISLENASLYADLIQENRERKHAEEALREANRRKDEFLAMLAHELRNPLAPISSAAQVLKLSRGDEKRVQQAAEIIARQAAHMTRLITDLLDVSRVTSGLVVLDKKPLDLKKMVTESIEQVQPLVEARRHRLQFDACPEAPIVLGDWTRLVQVMTNLLQNAAKFTPEGGVISIAIEQRADEAVVTVRDNGIGIDASLLPHIFELFSQEKRSSDRSQGGLGLGLSLVRSLISLHGGRVSVSSEGNSKGATFTLFFKRLAQSTEVQLVPQAPPLPQASKPLRLLVVDDNVDAARALALFLETSGHQVFVEHEPWAALARAKVAAPDAFLLDIGLPGMDGYELARQLRSAPHPAHATFIAVSGYEPREKDPAVADPFDHYFVKPVDTANLAALLAGRGKKPGASAPTR